MRKPTLLHSYWLTYTTFAEHFHVVLDVVVVDVDGRCDGEVEGDRLGNTDGREVVGAAGEKKHQTAGPGEDPVHCSQHLHLHATLEVVYPEVHTAAQPSPT